MNNKGHPACKVVDVLLCIGNDNMMSKIDYEVAATGLAAKLIIHKYLRVSSANVFFCVKK